MKFNGGRDNLLALVIIAYLLLIAVIAAHAQQGCTCERHGDRTWRCCYDRGCEWLLTREYSEIPGCWK